MVEIKIRGKEMKNQRKDDKQDEVKKNIFYHNIECAHEKFSRPITSGAFSAPEKPDKLSRINILRAQPFAYREPEIVTIPPEIIKPQVKKKK